MKNGYTYERRNFLQEQGLCVRYNEERIKRLQAQKQSHKIIKEELIARMTNRKDV